MGAGSQQIASAAGLPWMCCFAHARGAAKGCPCCLQAEKSQEPEGGEELEEPEDGEELEEHTSAYQDLVLDTHVKCNEVLLPRKMAVCSAGPSALRATGLLVLFFWP